ncbi:hypothetical protein [Pseudogulbenkiania sp. MAI-1]|uniref:DUF7940 domain-containing protein n=1 Tax=Pseudogulbenkiania sp. MAI-1 TaxID=990370 RepID=UPI00045E89C4|nr:hypothetical protein [Pseudogulbenkiania sp. MAI-1]
MRLIDNWKRAHRLWSVRLTALVAFITALEALQPQLAAVLPAHWYGWAMLVIGVARVIKQEAGNA